MKKEKYIPIPIKMAKHVARACKKQVVIIVAFDDVHNMEHVTTYGKSLRNCEVAAQIGNDIKRNILLWPVNKCKAVPRRLGGKGK